MTFLPFLKYQIKLRLDFSSCRVDNRNLSLFLHDVLDKTNIWWRTRARFLIPYMEFEESLISKVYGKDIVRVRYVGSYRETIASLHYADASSDIDIMYIYKNFDVLGQAMAPNSKNDASFNTQIVDASVPGYVYVKVVKPIKQIVNDFRHIAMKGEFHASLEIEKIMEFFEREVICNHDLYKATNSRLTGQFLRSDNFIMMHEKFNRERFAGWLMFQQCGPASKVYWNISGLPQRVKISPLDMVFALHCPHWPTQAAEWKRRRRRYNFPENKLINEITGYGVDLVAKSSCSGNNDGDYHFEWRLSFSIAEVTLVDRWNDTQKSCYRIMKTLHTDYLSKLGITSYSIKNIMFHLVETKNPGIWRPENLVTCLFLVLKSLRKLLKSKNCPHYFIEENNLFRDIADPQLEKAVKICDDLLSDIYGQIWISDGLWYEVCARGMDKYFYSLQYSLLESEKMHRSHIDSKPEWTRNLGCLFKVYYCVKVHKEVSRVFVNGSRSKHYDESVVIDALIDILRRLDTSSFSKCEEKLLIYCQVAWVYMKCLYWIENMKLDQEVHRKGRKKENLECGSTLKRTKLQDRVDEAFQIMQHLNPAHAEQISLIMDILSSNEDIDLNSLIRYSSGSLTESMPVVVCQVDSFSKDRIVAEFPYKDVAYYCPLNQLLFYAYLKQLRAQAKELGTTEDRFYNSYNELENLMSKVYTKQFRSIMKPFADHLHGRIVAMM